MAKKRTRRTSERCEAKEDDENDNNSITSLVTLNVGGTKYQVSRSLLDQHPNTMISRMVSDTWQTDGDSNERGCFIERNGARFAYVLDYMRDGRVSLPGGNSTCTKLSVLHELAYFGFADVKKESVEVEFAHVDASKYIARLTEDFNGELSGLIESRDKLNLDIAYLHVSHAICVRRMKSESENLIFSIAYREKSQVTSYYNTDIQYVFKDRSKNMLDFQVVEAVKATSLMSQQGALNTSLTKYGLRLSSYEEESCGRGNAWYNQNTRERTPLNGIVKVSMTVLSVT